MKAAAISSDGSSSKPDANTSNDVATVISTLKLICGAGGFAFPWAFAHMGLAGGTITVLGVAALGSFTMGELEALKTHVDTHHLVGRSAQDTTYADVARASVGMWGAYVVLIMTVIAGGGACCAYLAYIGTTLHSIVPGVPRGFFVLGAGMVLLPVTWLEDLSVLAKVAGFGIVAVLLGYCVTLGYALATLSPTSHPNFFTSLEASAEGFGPIAFLLCIHFAIFPLMSASQATSGPVGFWRLAAVALGIAAMLNGLFGALGYLYFGAEVSSIAINDIAARTICLTTTKLLICVDLLCTYPFCFVAISQLLDGAFLLLQEEEDFAKVSNATSSESETNTDVEGEKSHDLMLAPTFSDSRWRFVSRLLVLIVTVIGGLRGSFGGLVSLAGDLSMTSLGYVLPPIMTLTMLRGELSLARAVANVATLVIGTLVCTLSSSVTIAKMIRS